MTDYTSHLARNWDWWELYKGKLGEQELSEFMNRVYNLFIKMKPGSFFSIEKNVTEKNRDLFIKMCCMFIDETYHSPPSPHGYYELSADCTLLKHIELTQNNPLLNGNNRRYLQKDKQRP
jgi:hypothetical protein